MYSAYDTKMKYRLSDVSLRLYTIILLSLGL